MRLIVYDRPKTAQRLLPNRLQIEPTSYSWNAIGGPEQASITVWGNAEDLWETVEWLRCPVEIYDEQGDMVWWGYVDEVEIRVGAVTIGISLDSMANKIAVAYSFVDTGSQTVGTRKTTAWSSNSDSDDEYGTKELLESISGASDAMAEGVRDALLLARKYPMPVVQLSGENSLSATLRCRGWFDTLGWRHYSNTGTDSVVTTTQIGDILTSVGEFVTAADITDASGISSSEYRDGDNTALVEIMELLSAGTSSGDRLLATVTSGRRLTVYAEPTSGASDYAIDSSGLLYSQYGQLVEPHKCPVAFWAKLKDVIPDTADLTKIAKPSPVFIQRSEFNVSRQRLMLEAREAGSVWDVGGLR